MKKIYYFLALIFGLAGVTTPVRAQIFAPTGAQWHYSGHNAALPEFSGYVNFEATDEIEISARPCRRITQTHYDYTNQIIGQGTYYICTQADTAFYVAAENLSKFYTLYIFNQNAGDTLTLDFPDPTAPPGTTYRAVIDSVGSLVIDGVTLKTYHTSALDNFGVAGSGVFADRIGGLTWFFPTAVVGIPEGPGPIRCYSDMQVDTNFNTYPCDTHLEGNVNEKYPSGNMLIYPNPTNGKLMVDARFEVVDMTVYDGAGRVLARSRSENQIDLGALNAGLYRVKIQFESGWIRWVSVVKTE